jgi:tetratricopeptide (TPR) repeat protein
MKPRLLLAGLAVAALALLGRAESPRDAAVSLFQAKRYPEAREAFTQLVVADPRNAEAHYYLGVIALKRNDNATAIQELERATALDPQVSNYFMELGAAYGEAAKKAGLFSKLDLARKCQAALEQSVALNPDNIPARNGLISYYRAAPSFAGGGMNKAYEQAQEIRRRDPIAGASVLAQLALAEKKYDQAFDVYEEALRQSPDNYLMLYSIGRTAAQTGQRVSRGEAALRRCLALTPAAGDPSHAAVRWRLGNLAEKRNDPAAARNEYVAALQLDPGFTQAKESLEQLK